MFPVFASDTYHQLKNDLAGHHFVFQNNIRFHIPVDTACIPDHGGLVQLFHGEKQTGVARVVGKDGTDAVKALMDLAENIEPWAQAVFHMHTAFCLTGEFQCLHRTLNQAGPDFTSPDQLRAWAKKVLEHTKDDEMAYAVTRDNEYAGQLEAWVDWVFHNGEKPAEKTLGELSAMTLDLVEEISACTQARLFHETTHHRSEVLRNLPADIGELPKIDRVWLADTPGSPEEENTFQYGRLIADVLMEQWRVDENPETRAATVRWAFRHFCTKEEIGKKMRLTGDTVSRDLEDA